MSARKTGDELKEVMKQYNVDRIWSWSKFNCFHNSAFEYFLKYILKAKEDRCDSIYTSTGGISHDILEKLYTDITYRFGDMLPEFEDAWINYVDIMQLKFDRNNEASNEKIGNKYKQNLEHFFANHTVIPYNVMIEQFMTAMIGDNLFQGYIDCCFRDEDDNVIIVDFKTSSIYTGAKAENECGQLVVYAIGLNQKGIPMDKIKICWNFLKYVTIQYTQKNGDVKTRNVERCEIGEKMQANAKTWLKTFGYEPDEYLKAMIDTNSLDVLPPEVREKYEVNDCYVFIPLTEELINKWTTNICDTIKDIILREQDYKENKSNRAFWDTDESLKAQSYYLSTLCAYSPMLHLPYRVYLERQESGDADMFGGVGGGVSIPKGMENMEIPYEKKEETVTTASNVSESVSTADSLDWMNNLSDMSNTSTNTSDINSESDSDMDWLKNL